VVVGFTAIVVVITALVVGPDSRWTAGHALVWITLMAAVITANWLIVRWRRSI